MAETETIAEISGFCLLATMKDEGPWLLEWIAHHKAVGFDRIVVATNDCSDGTDRMLERLQEMGLVRTLDNPPPHSISLQTEAYERARRTPEAAMSEWVMTLDADEFLNIHMGDGTLADLMAAHPDKPEAIIFNWRVFGDSNHPGFEDKPVCENFTLAASYKTRLAQVKTLVRNHWHYSAFGPHGPWLYSHNPKTPVHAVTAAGMRLPDDVFQGDMHIHSIERKFVSWKAAQINHYIVRTRDVFDLKLKRGRAHASRKIPVRHTPEFFNKMNVNHEEDTTISRSGKARAEWLARLMADPVLGRLHAEAVASLKARITANKAETAAVATTWARTGQSLRDAPEFDALAETLREAAGGGNLIYIPAKGDLGESFKRTGARALFDDRKLPHVIRKADALAGSGMKDYAKLAGTDNPVVVLGSGSGLSAELVAKLGLTGKPGQAPRVVVLPDMTGATAESLGLESGNCTVFSACGAGASDDRPFCHDMAFCTEPTIRPPKQNLACFFSGKTIMQFKPQLPVLNQDIQAEGHAFAPLNDFFARIALSRIVHTDRIHVAIVGALVGVDLTLYAQPGSAAAQVFQASVAPYYDNVVLKDFDALSELAAVDAAG